MKKILMIVHTFPPIGSVGGSIRIVKFLKYINELRSDFYSTIITIRSDFILLNDFQLAQTSIPEIPNKNIKIIRTNTLQPRHPNPYKGIEANRIKKKKKKYSWVEIKIYFKIIYNFIDNYFLIPDYAILWFPYLITHALREAKKVDLIYATAPPFSVLIQAVIIKKITKKKLILDIKDDWIYQPKFLSRPFIVRRIEEKLEKYCVKNADKIILVTPKSFEDFKVRYPQYKDKFSMITNGCDIEEYKKYWNINYKPNAKFTIIYSGGVSTAKNPQNFFEALVELRKEGIINENNFRMNFIGQLHHNISSMIFDKKLDDLVHSYNYFEREEYIQIISKAELLLAINYQIKTLIPGKLYDYWGSRRPILLIDSLDSMAAELVTANNLGIVKDFSDVIGIKETIYNYFKSWNDNNISDKTNIENLYNYDRKNLTRKFIEIIDDM